VNDESPSDPFEETRIEWTATPGQMDEFWASGWRHFGPVFFRHRVMPYGDQIMTVQPLRVVLDRFHPSKSQRRVLRRNADLLTSVGPTVLNNDLRQMFEAHAQRFTVNVPPNLETFLGLQPDTVPCENMTLAVHSGERLVAASFLDLGKVAVSSLYGIFDLAESGQSPSSAPVGSDAPHCGHFFSMFGFASFPFIHPPQKQIEENVTEIVDTPLNNILL